MKYAYYPGCSLQATAKEYDQSTRAVCRRLGIELVEIPDWNCCGATAAHSTNQLLNVGLAARNLALAAEIGPEVLVPCAACYQRLAFARQEMDNDPEMRERVARATGRDFSVLVRVRSLLEVLAGLNPERLSVAVTRPLKGLKTACYYGCLLVRPPKVTGFDDPEHPRTMDELVRLAGAEPVDWDYKTECCGGAHGVAYEPLTLKLVRDILAAASRAGAEVLVCACPLCQGNLDARQSHVNRAYGTNFQLPVLYFTQLIGSALGLDDQELGLDTLFVDPRPVLRALK